MDDLPSKKNLPWFPFYPTDWFGSQDITAMDIAAEGAFFRLLCYAWVSPDCSLIADDAHLAKLSKLGKRRWAKHKKAILSKFLTNNGRICNQRLFEIWKTQMARSESARFSRSKRGSERSTNVQRTKNDRPTNVQHARSVSESLSLSEVVSSSKKPDYSVSSLSNVNGKGALPVEFEKTVDAMRSAWKKIDRNNVQILQQYVASEIHAGATLGAIASQMSKWAKHWDAVGWQFCQRTVTEMIQNGNWKIEVPKTAREIMRENDPMEQMKARLKAKDEEERKRGQAHSS